MRPFFPLASFAIRFNILALPRYHRQRVASKKSLIFPLCVLLISSLCPPLSLQAQTAGKFKITPSKVQKGADRKYDIYLKAEDDSAVNDLKVTPSEGSGVKVLKTLLSADNKTMVVTIEVNENADIGPTRLRVGKEGEAFNFVDLEVIGLKPIDPSPVPEGIPYKVDAMWLVMPDKVARDNFGKRIADQYYCIEVVIGNNSGFAMQISGIGFRAVLDKDTKDGNTNELAKYEIPTSSRRMVRQSVVREKDFGRRALALNLIEGVGTLAGGFIPFFRVANTKANYSTFTSILGNQFKEGFKFAVPDLTVAQLNRLDEEIIRDGLIIENNRSERTVVFIPKGSLYYAFEDNNEARKNPGKIMQVLGDLIIVGKKIEVFQNREIVIASRSARPAGENGEGNVTEGGPFSPLGDNATISLKTTPQIAEEGIVYESGLGPQQSAQDQNVVILIKGENLGTLTLEPAEDATNFLTITNQVPSNNQVRATVRVRANTPYGTYHIRVKSGSFSQDLPFEVRQ